MSLGVLLYPSQPLAKGEDFTGLECQRGVLILAEGWCTEGRKHLLKNLPEEGLAVKTTCRSIPSFLASQKLQRVPFWIQGGPRSGQ